MAKKVVIPWEEMIEDRLSTIECEIEHLDIPGPCYRLTDQETIIKKLVDKVIQLSFRIANLEEGKPKFARFQDRRDASTMKKKVVMKKRKPKY